MHMQCYANVNSGKIKIHKILIKILCVEIYKFALQSCQRFSSNSASTVQKIKEINKIRSNRCPDHKNDLVASNIYVLPKILFTDALSLIKMNNNSVLKIEIHLQAV